MPRHLLVLVLGGIPFILLSVALVQTEGAAHRRAFQAAGNDALAARLVEDVRPPLAVAIKPDKTPEPTPKSVAATRPEPPPAEKPAAEPPPLLQPTEVARIDPPKPPAPEPPKSAAPSVPKLQPFDLKKDPLALTADEEKKLGGVLHEAILDRHRHVNAPGLQRSIVEAARPLLAQRLRKEIESYRFTILDDDKLNAFSHLGGFVYLSRGLFHLLAEDAELQFVLAHEIAHVDLKHDIKDVAESYRAAEKAGSAPDLLRSFYRQIAVGHTDDQEYEADARAFRQVRGLGMSRRLTLSFPRRYLAYVEQNAIEGRRKPRSAFEDDLQDVANHWLAHPAALDRLERLEHLPANP